MRAVPQGLGLARAKPADSFTGGMHALRVGCEGPPPFGSAFGLVNVCCGATPVLARRACEAVREFGGRLFQKRLVLAHLIPEDDTHGIHDCAFYIAIY